MSVLSFDIGLRNLAVAHMVRSDVEVPPDVRAFTRPDEPLEEYRARGFAWFVRHGWALVRWGVFDVSDALEREGGVANVKRLNDATKATALAATLTRLHGEWLGGGPGAAAAAAAAPAGAGHGGTAPSAAAPALPTVVAVEAQHNGNAIMRGVAMGLLVFWRLRLPDARLVLMSGSQKLKACDALGVGLGAGLAAVRDAKAAKAAAKAAKAEAAAAKAAAKAEAAAAKAAAKVQAAASKRKRGLSENENAASNESVKRLKTEDCGSGGVGGGGSGVMQPAAAAPAPVVLAAAPPARKLPPGFGRNIPKTGAARDKYDDNKRRAEIAVRVLMPAGHPVLDAHPGKQDDLCDALLMGIVALWDQCAWRPPARTRAKKPAGK
jgi:hypothetical protein